MNTKLKNEKAEIDKSKLNSIEVDYNDLLRKPYEYENENIKLTVKITEVISTSQNQIGYKAIQDNNEWYINYTLPRFTPRILVDDTVTFYGKFTQIETMNKKEIPGLKALYFE